MNADKSALNSCERMHQVPTLNIIPSVPRQYSKAPVGFNDDDDKLLLFRNLVLKQISSILVWSLVQTHKKQEDIKQKCG